MTNGAQGAWEASDPTDSCAGPAGCNNLPASGTDNGTFGPTDIGTVHRQITTWVLTNTVPGNTWSGFNTAICTDNEPTLTCNVPNNDFTVPGFSFTVTNNSPAGTAFYVDQFEGHTVLYAFPWTGVVKVTGTETGPGSDGSPTASLQMVDQVDDVGSPSRDPLRNGCYPVNPTINTDINQHYDSTGQDVFYTNVQIATAQQYVYPFYDTWYGGTTNLSTPALSAPNGTAHEFAPSDSCSSNPFNWFMQIVV